MDYTSDKKNEHKYFTYLNTSNIKCYSYSCRGEVVNRFAGCSGKSLLCQVSLVLFISFTLLQKRGLAGHGLLIIHVVKN